MNDVTVRRRAGWRERIDYQGLFLGIVCAVMTLSLLIGDRNTVESIRERQMEDRLVNLGQVLPTEFYDNNPLADVIVVDDAALGAIELYPAKKAGVLTAAAFQIKTVGYGGDIVLMMGVRADGEILGVRVLSHKETPGLADKIDIGKSNWITIFNGKSLQNTARADWAVKKDGGRIDQFTGATITPRAVVRGIRNGLEFYQRHAPELAASHAERENKS